jgi:hypothetical protein
MHIRLSYPSCEQTHASLLLHMPFEMQVGMSGGCYPDALINSIPNLYYYAANNPRWVRLCA